MRILVTGGTGNVGRTAVRHLVAQGHQVRVLGRRSDIAIEGAEYQICDITDFDKLLQQVGGMEAIVHLAAISHPGGAPSQEVFRINCVGTYNVYQAAVVTGIPRIASASSINALGFNYGTQAFPIRYFPVDEDHPVFTTDSYSFSKQIGEEIGDYFYRRDGLSSVNLRFPAVYEMTLEREEEMRSRLNRYREAFAELMALPELERRVQVDRAIRAFDATRRARLGPMSREERRAMHQQMWEEPGMHLIMGGFGRSNFWASVDARDAAQALERGVTGDYEGSHPLFINDSHNAPCLDAESLARVFFPEAARRRPLQGNESLVSIERARQILGYEPEFSTSRWFE